MTSTTTPRPIAAEPALGQTVTRLLTDYADASSQDVWQRLLQLGIAEVGAQGQGPGGPVDACGLLAIAGYHARSLPMAEAGLLGRWLAERAGWTLQDDATLTVAPPDATPLVAAAHTGPIELTWHDVPWLPAATSILAPVLTDAGEYAVHLTPDEVKHGDGANLAGEARSSVIATVSLDSSSVAAVPDGTCHALRARGALSRAALIAGSLRRSVALAATHAASRTQFGKPLSKFQAISHLLAVAAEHAALADAAVRVAAEALEQDPADPTQRVAIARAVTHSAVRVVTRNTHQVFGAMGVTKECELSEHTVRQLSWDNEWGLAAEHTARFTEDVLTHSDDFWVAFTRTTPTPN